MEHLRYQQGGPDTRPPGGEGHAQGHAECAKLEPAHRVQAVKPGTLGVKDDDLHHHPQTPKESNRGFVVTQLVQIKREVKVNGHVGKDVKKHCQEKPAVVGFLQDLKHRFFCRMGVHTLFAVGDQPSTHIHRKQGGRGPSDKVVQAMVLKPKTSPTHGQQKTQRPTQTHPTIALGIKAAFVAHPVREGRFGHGHHGARMDEHDQHETRQERHASAF